MGKKQNKKRVYIVLSYTGTILSKFIKLYTGKEFSHVSIALNEELDGMCSFGRLNAYNPFIAGFVHESTEFGTFKRFKNSTSLIYYIEVNDEQYEMIKENIKNFELNKDSYSFNMIGLLFAGINVKVKRKNKFYCAEFVKYVLDNSQVNIDVPDIVKPEDFINLSDKNIIYKGKLIDYNI